MKMEEVEEVQPTVVDRCCEKVEEGYDSGFSCKYDRGKTDHENVRGIDAEVGVLETSYVTWSDDNVHHYYWKVVNVDLPFWFGLDYGYGCEVFVSSSDLDHGLCHDPCLYHDLFPVLVLSHARVPALFPVPVRALYHVPYLDFETCSLSLYV